MKDCVYCVGGYAYEDGVSTGKTCQDACDGDCCVGEDIDEVGPCDGFSGVLERNGACSGGLSCWDANIVHVSNSCVGFGACADVGYGEGTVDKIVNQSCVGRVCELINSSVSLLFAHCRTIHLIIGQSACYRMALEGGHVGEVVSSCNGEGGEDWLQIFFLSLDFPTCQCQSNTSSSCSACPLLAFGGDVRKMAHSCNDGVEDEVLLCLDLSFFGRV